MKKQFQQRSYLHNGLIVIVYTLTGKADRAHQTLAGGNMNNNGSLETGNLSNGILSNQIYPGKSCDSQGFMAGLPGQNN